MIARIVLIFSFVLVFAGGFALATYFASKDWAEPGDWLSFSGGLLGAFFAVLGALMVVDLQAAEERRRTRVLLRELLYDVRTAATNAATAQPDGTHTAAELQRRAVDTLAHKVERVKEARQWITPHNAKVVRAFGYIGEITIDAQQLKDRTAGHEAEGVNLTDDLRCVVDKVNEALREL